MSRADVAAAIMSATGPHVDLFNIAGPHNTTKRQAVMLALTGRKLPKAQCGIHALDKAAHEYFRPEIIGHNTPAARDKALADAIREAAQS